MPYAAAAAAAAFSLRFHFSVSIVSLILAFMNLIQMDVFQCEMTQSGVNVARPLPPTAAIWWAGVKKKKQKKKHGDQRWSQETACFLMTHLSYLIGGEQRHER